MASKAKPLTDLRALQRNAKPTAIHNSLRALAEDTDQKPNRALWKAYYEGDNTTVLDRSFLMDEGPLDKDWFRIMKQYVDNKLAPTPREVGAKVPNPVAKVAGTVAGLVTRKKT